MGDEPPGKGDWPEPDGNAAALQQLMLETPSDGPQPPGQPSIASPAPPQGTIDGSQPQDPYTSALHADLCTRYEEPNAAARWDSPLYTVLWDDKSPPAERIWQEIVLGIKADGKTMGEVRMNAATVLVCPCPIVPYAEPRWHREKTNRLLTVLDAIHAAIIPTHA